MNPYPPFGLVELPWYEILAAPLRAEEISREVWINELTRKWGLIRINDDE